MNGWRRRGICTVSLLCVLLLVTGCQGTKPDQAAAPATPSDSASAGAEGLPPLPGEARVDSPSELRLGGELGAPVKIEVFSDYQCPRCRDFYLETLRPLLDEYTRANRINRLYLVYHDYPLDMHQFSRKAASYGIAAARLGRDLWLRVTDVLYKEQAQWAQDGNIEAVLSRVMSPTELARLENMALTPSIAAAVQDAVMFAQSRNITSTPTFFISSKNAPQQRIAGFVAYATLKDYLDRLLNQAK